MSAAKHTPGPWSAEGFDQVLVGRGDFYGGLIVGEGGEVVVAQCVAPHNAPLLAAAPELLEALQRIEIQAEFAGAESILKLARAAIAAATGSQQ
jgi:hypothetical protein